jgi:hypothetical protein
MAEEIFNFLFFPLSVLFSEENDDDFRERRRDFPEKEWDSRGSRDDFDSDRKKERQFKDEFHDDDEFTSVESTHTTRTEKIVTERRTRSVGKKLDLAGAAATLGVDAKV